MRHWIVCLLALSLAGCWMSARPEIPADLLVQPPGLPGRYWTVSLEDSVSEPGLIEFRRDADGAMIGDTAGHSGGGRFRLVTTAIPGVFLKIIDNNDKSVFYAFLEHRNLGAWQEYGIAAIDDDVFAGPNFAWMQQLAARYELTLDASDSDQTVIGGKLHGFAIPSLFADPAFLATLEVQPGQLFLPAPPAPEERDELFAQGDYSPWLQLDQPDLPGAQWVAPDGLEGRYFVSETAGNAVRPAGVALARLPDGRFEVIAADGQSPLGSPKIIGLLPLERVEDEFLSVGFDHWINEGREIAYLSLGILSPTERGWSIARIVVRGTGTLIGREDLLTQPMAEAAQRQGLAFDRSGLRGEVTGQSLLALLQDGQFTTGLKVDREFALHYWAEREGNGEIRARR